MATPSTATVTPQRRKSPSKKGSPLGRMIGALLLIVLSPGLLLLDALRSGPSHRNTLYAFMLLTTALMALTGMAVVVTEAPTSRLFTMLGNVGDGVGIEVPQDKQLDAIYQSAMRYRIDPQLVLAVIKAESNFRAGEVSPKGAKGLMQIMPQTWRHYRPGSICDGVHRKAMADHGRDCIFDSEANIETGVHYLRDLLDHYHGRVDLAVEAYNAGLTNVDPTQKPKFTETRSYIQRIASYWAEIRRDPVAVQIQWITALRHCLRNLYILCGVFWLILFFWVARRILPGEGR